MTVIGLLGGVWLLAWGGVRALGDVRYHLPIFYALFALAFAA